MKLGQSFALGVKYWGLLNMYWGSEIDGGKKWGLHLFILDKHNWFWGCFDDEYERIFTYWGLGPLGFISRINI